MKLGFSARTSFLLLMAMGLAVAAAWFVRTSPDSAEPAPMAIHGRTPIHPSGRVQSQREPNTGFHEDTAWKMSASADESGSVGYQAASAHSEEPTEAMPGKTGGESVGRIAASGATSSSIHDAEALRTVPHVAWLAHRTEVDHVPAIIPPFHPADGTREAAKQPSSALDAVKEAFDREAGVGEVDEESPAYLSRWKQAEVSAAERVRSLYGWAAYNEYQREASLRRQEAAVAGGK